jgi:hypothetical protein
MQKKAVIKKPATKVATKVTSERIERDESGMASDQMIPAPIVSMSSTEPYPVDEPKKPLNREVAGADKHISIMLRRYEWLDILDTIDFMDGKVGLAANRIRAQLGPNE